MKGTFLVVFLIVLICRQLQAQGKSVIFLDSLNFGVIAKIKKGTSIKYLKIGEIKEKKAKIRSVEDSFIVTKSDTIRYSDLNILMIRKFDYFKFGVLLYCVSSSVYFFIKYPTIEAFNNAGSFAKVWSVSGLITNVPASVYIAINPYSYHKIYLQKLGVTFKVINK